MKDVNDLIGKQFQSGGRGPNVYDCYGLVREVYHRHGIDLPDYSIAADACQQIEGQIEEEKTSGKWIQIDEPEIPCLVLLRCHVDFVQHLGVYVGAGKFLHIREEKEKGVVVNRLDDPLWKKRFRGFWEYVQ